MVYYIGLEDKARNTAGAKAPADIKELCRRRGYCYAKLNVSPVKKSKTIRRVYRYLNAKKLWSHLRKNTKSGDVILYQHPIFGWREAQKNIPKMQKNGIHFIALIHDLESLRKGINGVIASNEKKNYNVDNVFLKHFDAIICHNEKMKQYMVSQGFNPSKLINLGLFDYLSECDPEKNEKAPFPSVAIAGNLAKGKCSYIYDIADGVHNVGLKIHLYGINYDDSIVNDAMIYHGSFSPEELPNHLKGDFGLVWDGNSSKTCEGNTGEYLKFNNPHKVSLYLSSNMPVIVWNQAAIADFVIENGVGIAIGSLYELETVIKSISDEEYKKMCENAKKVSKKLREGYYFYTAFSEALKITEQ